jgi:hypothetical protein
MAGPGRTRKAENPGLVQRLGSRRAVEIPERVAGAIHPKEVTMRSPKTTLLVLALVVIAITAWAGNSAVASKPKSGKDNGTVVAQVQPASEDKKPDQAIQSKPKQDQAPESKNGAAQAPEHRPDNAQPPQSEHNAVQAPESKPNEVQAPTSSQPREPRAVTEPTPRVVRPVESGQTDRGSSDAGQINVPQSGGEPDRGRRRDGGSHGGYDGGHSYDPFDRRPTHFFGGQGWHGRHDQWRYGRFHGSWRFLFYLGPVTYYPPIHYPYVIRIPHDRVGVYVRYTGEDAVGSAFANSVREHLRDEGLRVVYSQDDARLELYIISMEQDPDNPGYNSSISVSYIWYPGDKFITAQMVDAGLNEVDDLAQSVAGYVDDLVDEYR